MSTFSALSFQSLIVYAKKFPDDMKNTHFLYGIFLNIRELDSIITRS